MSSNPYEDLLQAVRIEVITEEGKHRYGTGFPHSFCDKRLDEGAMWGIPAIVTNRHVIEDGSEGSLFFNKRDSNNHCIFGEKIEVRFQRRDWIDHPNENIDLSVLPLLPRLNHTSLRMENLFIKYYNALIPNDQTWKMFSPIEEIVTIGYPNGIWDEFNGIPITRKGITATHPKLDYKQQAAFWVDVTIYPGMSGSPVLIHSYGTEYYQKGGMSHGAKTYFLGILSKMTVYNKSKLGIEISVIPADILDKAILGVISSLGYVIKVTKLKDFDRVLKSLTHVPS